MSFGLKAIISIGLPILLGGIGGSGRPTGATDSEHSHGYDGSGSIGGGFLGFLKSGAKALSDSREGKPVFGTTEMPQPRTVKELTRGQTAPGGLSSPMQQLFQQAAVMEAMQHYRQNGSRDVNMQSLMNDLGYVRPTTPQGKKTVVTERPELSEIEVR